MSALYRKYRPQVFEDVVGQEPVVQTLRRAIKQNRVGHAYLFSGPRGTGKTTVARILAKAMNCLGKGDPPCGKCRNCLDIAQGKFIDLIEIDAASNRGIDEIRELRDKIKFSPSVGRKKVYIIDEVHMLTREAFNALLKTLEEPPEHSVFIFATTEVHKVPETVSSRCQRFDFRLGQEETVAGTISKIARREKLKLSKDALSLVVKSSGGSYRDAVSALDQLSSHITSREIEVHEAVKVLNLTALDQVVTLVDDLKKSDLVGAIGHLRQLDEVGVDWGQFTTSLIRYLREELIEAIVKSADLGWHKMALERFIQAESDLKLSPIESLALELAAIDLCGTGERVKGKGESGPPQIQNKIDNPPKPKSHPHDVRPGRTLRGGQEIEVHPVRGGDRSTSSMARPVEVQTLSSNRHKTAISNGARETKTRTKEVEVKVSNITSEERLAIIDRVTAKNKPLGFLLSACEWRLQDSVLVLEVGYPLYRDKILSFKSRQILDAEIKSVLKAQVPVECKVVKSIKDDTVEENIADGIDEVFG